MVTKSILTCLQKAKEKNWVKTYWAFDIHGTILKPNFKPNEITKEFYPHAREVLQMISSRPDIVRILYTCSYPHEIEQYLSYFHTHGIYFDYVNENPEVVDGSYGYYQDKFYSNVLIDDKAGFDGNTDWLPIKETLLQHFKY